MALRVTKADFDKKVLENELPVLVDFYSDSCVACKRLVPVLGDLEDEFENKIEVVKVNTNFDMELCQIYKVMSNPTLILFQKGVEVERKIGFIPYPELEKLVEPYL